MKTAIIFGSTGLIGGLLLRQLVENEEYKKIKIFIRSPIAIRNSKVEIIQTDFNKVENVRNQIIGDECFFCIGTTRKKTPNKQDYINIEYTLPIKIGEICKENNIEIFTYISSIGAGANKSNLYLRNKGMAEEKLEKLNFKKFVVIRPSFLLGNRNEKRWGEKIGIFAMNCVSPFLVGKLKKYRSINSEIVVKSIIKIINSNIPGGIFEPPQLLSIEKDQNF